MDTIFLDTNAIRNRDANTFFGNIQKYNKLSEITQIIIPSIVIEEIKQQKWKHLKEQLGKFRSNYFTSLFIEPEMVGVLDAHITERIDELYNKAYVEFPYKEIELEHDGKLEKMKQLAIQNKAPFAAGTDKGFKDAYIYFIILQYLEIADDDVFLITNDARLGEALQEKVIVLNAPDDYYKFREEFFKEEYFLSKINEHFHDDSITQADILNIQLTEENDWEITIEFEGKERTLLVDFVSREIISE